MILHDCRSPCGVQTREERSLLNISTYNARMASQRTERDPDYKAGSPLITPHRSVVPPPRIVQRAIQKAEAVRQKPFGRKPKAVRQTTKAVRQTKPFGEAVRRSCSRSRSAKPFANGKPFEREAVRRTGSRSPPRKLNTRRSRPRIPKHPSGRCRDPATS